jgi:alginate O-acetyltransferase complex protein AlgI
MLILMMYVRAISFYLLVSASNDIKIACAALGGFRLHENYDYPYFKRNLALFWRSWHMTLIRFLRDYIYIPLGGNRKHVYFNILVVFLSAAFWHVTGKAFLLWGLWHGLGMCIFRYWQDFWKGVEHRNRKGLLLSLQSWSRAHSRFVGIFSTLLTFHFVALGWLPFWGGHPQGASMILRIISGNRWKLFEW